MSVLNVEGSNELGCALLDVPAPAVTLPTDEEFWSKERPGLPDIKFLKDHFYREGRLTEEQAIYILQKGTEILKAEPNLLEVGAPITGKRVHL